MINRVTKDIIEPTKNQEVARPPNANVSEPRGDNVMQGRVIFMGALFAAFVGGQAFAQTAGQIGDCFRFFVAAGKAIGDDQVPSMASRELSEGLDHQEVAEGEVFLMLGLLGVGL